MFFIFQVEGISLDIMKDALHQAKLGRQHILEEMRNSFPPPRNRLGEYTPKIVRVQVALDMVNFNFHADTPSLRPSLRQKQILQFLVMLQCFGAF